MDGKIFTGILWLNIFRKKPMSTSADTIIYLSDQLTSLGSRIRTRKMFGEYAMYCDERVVALICDDQLFVKITDPGKLFVGSKYEEGFPYPGAKPAILVGGDIIENKEAFAQLIDITAKAVPMPKPKKPKVKKVWPKPKLTIFLCKTKMELHAHCKTM